MLFKELINKPDLVIIDEQQKFSRSQREKLLTSTTHLLEVFTTPIPRTTALIKFGALKVWKITKNHTKKTIYSHLLIGKTQGMKILKAVKEKVKNNEQAIIVYALKQESKLELLAGMMSAENAYEKWNKVYPGRVRLVHSEMSD